MPKIYTTAPAALIWLPEGQKPTVASFGAEKMVLEDAIDRTTAEEDAHPDELPWIKTEGNILGLSDIAQLKSGLRAMSMFRPPRT